MGLGLVPPDGGAPHRIAAKLRLEAHSRSELEHYESCGRHLGRLGLRQLCGDEPAIGLVTDDDDSVSAPVDDLADAGSGRTGAQPVVRLRADAQPVPERLGGLPGTPERARQDGVRLDAVRGEPVRELTGLLLARRRERPLLVVRRPRLGFGVANQVDAHPERGG